MQRNYLKNPVQEGDQCAFKICPPSLLRAPRFSACEQQDGPEEVKNPSLWLSWLLRSVESKAEWKIANGFLVTDNEIPSSVSKEKLSLLNRWWIPRQPPLRKPLQSSHTLDIWSHRRNSGMFFKLIQVPYIWKYYTNFLLGTSGLSPSLMVFQTRIHTTSLLPGWLFAYPRALCCVTRHWPSITFGFLVLAQSQHISIRNFIILILMLNYLLMHVSIPAKVLAVSCISFTKKT